MLAFFGWFLLVCFIASVGFFICTLLTAGKISDYEFEIKQLRYEIKEKNKVITNLTKVDKKV
jgi:hypothetical protein